jgi:hypothetical protein
MPAHRSRCEWFWAWTGVEFALVFAFVGIFSIGPFLLPLATLALAVCACRRPAPRWIAAGVLVALAGIAAALTLSPDVFLATPLATLAIGLAPGVPRGVASGGRAVLPAASARG